MPPSVTLALDERARAIALERERAARIAPLAAATSTRERGHWRVEARDERVAVAVEADERGAVGALELPAAESPLLMPSQIAPSSIEEKWTPRWAYSSLSVGAVRVLGRDLFERDHLARGGRAGHEAGKG